MSPAFTHVFAAHGDRQAGEHRSRTDPQEEPTAELHDVEVNHLLQDLLRKIVQRHGVARRPVLRLVHFLLTATSQLRLATG